MMRRGLRISGGGVIRTSGGLRITVPSAEAPASSSVLVSGAGSGEVNGLYTPRGTQNGKPYYNAEAEPDDPLASSIYWDGFNWNITFRDTTTAYTSSEDVSQPWDVVVWGGVVGIDPVPTVTQYVPPTETPMLNAADAPILNAANQPIYTAGG